MADIANELLKKIKANQPEKLTEANDFLGTIPKGNMIKGFLESLLERKSDDGTLLNDIQMIALYGEWGSGKTSLMNYIRAKLNEKDFKTIFFPSWEIEKDDNLALSLLEAITESVDGVDKTDVKKAFLAIGKGIGKSVSAKIGPLNINFKEIIEYLEKYDNEITDDSALKKINEFKTKYSELETEVLKKASCEKLIVFIDDLDRCEPENVLNLLSAIKLFFTYGKNTIFICGLDEKAVDEAVKVKYENVVKSGEYMEKIFDISFNMPNPNINKMVAYYFDDIPDAVYGAQEFFREMHFTNPRHLKKVLNKYMLIRYYQEGGLDKDGLIPDQNVEFFMYLTLFVIILYNFEIDQYRFLKNYDTKVSGIKSLLTVESSAVNQKKGTIGEEYTIINNDEKKYILDVVYGKTLKGIIKSFISKGLTNDSDYKYFLKILITIFAPNIESYKPFDDINDYIQQFYKSDNVLSYWCKYVFLKYSYDNFKNTDLIGLMENNEYRIWNIFDMAECYL